MNCKDCKIKISYSKKNPHAMRLASRRKTELCNDCYSRALNKTCICGKKIRVKISRHKYCSIKCQIFAVGKRYRERRRVKYRESGKWRKNCKNCNIQLSGRKPIFCSHRCCHNYSDRTYRLRLKG